MRLTSLVVITMNGDLSRCLQCKYRHHNVLFLFAWSVLLLLLLLAIDYWLVQLLLLDHTRHSTGNLKAELPVEVFLFEEKKTQNDWALSVLAMFLHFFAGGDYSTVM